MNAEAKAAIDWGTIEVDYRAGIKPLRQIAEAAGISHAAITKRAKRDGWERAEVSRVRRSVKMSDAPRPAKVVVGFLYVLSVHTAGADRLCKIGMAVSFSERLNTHQTSCPYNLQVLCCYFVGDMRAEERTIHALFADKRVRGEWFALTDDDLRTIAARSLLL